jgi:DNA-binding MarR family transcriptional regulator
MKVLVDGLEDLEGAVLGTLRESGLVLDAVQLAERLSVMPSDVERAAVRLVDAGELNQSPGRFGDCYAVRNVTRRRSR